MKGKSYCPPGANKMRNIGGVKAPPMGTNPKIEKEAKGKTVGIIYMEIGRASCRERV